MFAIKRIMVALVVLVAVVLAQSTEPPLSEKRLTIHTLVREDIFAGFLANDLERLTRGEKSIETLLTQRPQAKAELLAWKGGATLYRAVHALENKRAAEFQQKYEQAQALFAEALQLGPQIGGVHAVTGGSYAQFADRLPKDKRAAAWAQAYDSFQVLWKQQGAFIDKLPVHLRGEVLGGLAQAAQRTGRTQELTQALDKIIEVLPNTPYEPIAQQWKKNPAAATNATIACMTCHEDGRLAASLARLN